MMLEAIGNQHAVFMVPQAPIHLPTARLNASREDVAPVSVSKAQDNVIVERIRDYTLCAWTHREALHKHARPVRRFHPSASAPSRMSKMEHRDMPNLIGRKLILET